MLNTQGRAQLEGGRATLETVSLVTFSATMISTASIFLTNADVLKVNLFFSLKRVLLHQSAASTVRYE